MYDYTLDELVSRYPVLLKNKNDIEMAADAVVNCFKAGGKLLLCGNGGSCADCDHITGELLKGFLSRRTMNEESLSKSEEICKINGLYLDAEDLKKLQGGLPAVSLCSLSALNSAFANDVDPVLVYAQGVMSLGQKNDIVICISTSGNSANVLKAASAAKLKGLKVISLTGKTGGKLKRVSDITINVDETETFKIQELHLPVYHYICAAAEKAMFA